MSGLDTSRNTKLQIAILADKSGFPDGMASASRVRLMALAMQHAGAQVAVLHTGCSEPTDRVINMAAYGVYREIRFKYTTGTTMISRHRMARRWKSAVGAFRGIVELRHLRRNGRLNILLLYAPWDFDYMGLYELAARMLRIPVVGILQESPFLVQGLALPLRRLLLPRVLPLMSGVISISSYLTDWYRNEALRLGIHLPILQVPILVDADEQDPTEYPCDSKEILFASSPQYQHTIRFLLRSMEFVWSEMPGVRLVITGSRLGGKGAEWLRAELRVRCRPLAVEVAGHLPRTDLLQRYSRSRALLIPLFEDTRSRARFPTKIGEYLVSGRPVVTHCVGEVPAFLEHRRNAYVCEPGGAEAFGSQIVSVLSEPDEANRIGLAGRKTAQELFDYRRYGASLVDFLASLT